MLKNTITTFLLTGLCSLPVAAKITLEDAEADAKWAAEQNAHLNYKLEVLGSEEFDPNQSGSSNQMGAWVKISSSVTQWENAGAYAQVISPNATGQSCIKGSKALISNQHTESRCVSHNSNGTMCTSHKTIVVTPTDSGYKAECR